MSFNIKWKEQGYCQECDHEVKYDEQKRRRDPLEADISWFFRYEEAEKSRCTTRYVLCVMIKIV